MTDAIEKPEDYEIIDDVICYKGEEISEQEVLDSLQNALRQAARTGEVQVPNEKGKNRYGLDMAYFRNLINRELNRPLVDFKPDELARVFARASRTADDNVMREPEFARTGGEVEAFAWVSEAQETGQLIDGRPRKLWWECKAGVGTPLYTHPTPAAAVPDGWTASIEMIGERECVEITSPKGNSVSFSSAVGREPYGKSRRLLCDLADALTAAPQPVGNTQKATGNHHVLKTDPIVFQEVWGGSKTWEVRLNDRNFRQGDSVTLLETNYSGEDIRKGAPLEYTGREIFGRVGYVLNGPVYGLSEGWCIFSFIAAPQPVGESEKEKALQVLRDNVRAQNGDVRYWGLYDNDAVRDALHALLSAQPPEGER